MFPSWEDPDIIIRSFLLFTGVFKPSECHTTKVLYVYCSTAMFTSLSLPGWLHLHRTHTKVGHQVPSLENWGGGLKSLLWHANSPHLVLAHAGALLCCLYSAFILSRCCRAVLCTTAIRFVCCWLDPACP